ncbi:ABC-2 type transport system permease protein [Kitasatospora sp. MAP12-15]|uniref:ABC transporter permease n=1 Tax=unclassified Kitasatospora TaxID=2633591 RepID=UPI00247418CC|nr:ABC transporter permease [Kitasatospora sp. MAP12-44]MDH6114752.1 ABC-2 type transport system permease protein [Kitasatospora sp. MAP12-44]
MPVRTVRSRDRVSAALAGEWIKLRSLRSLSAVLLGAAVFSVGLAVLVCSNYQARWADYDARRQAAFQPADTGLGYLQIAVLFFGALGALAVTSEYGSGLIRSTLAATPQRGQVLAAKTVLVGAVSLVAATTICATAFLAGQSRLSTPVPHAGLGDPGVLRSVLGGALYLALAALLGLFLGALVRSAAVALSALFGIFLVLPTMVDSLPHDALWRATVPYLPSNLGAALWHTHTAGLTAPGIAALGLAAYVLVLAVAGLLALRGRDA